MVFSQNRACQARRVTRLSRPCAIWASNSRIIPVKITGLDGATSTILPSGDALWVFGDSVEGPFTSITTVDLKDKLSNTAAVVPMQRRSGWYQAISISCAANGIRPRQLVPFAAGEDPAKNRVWPMHGVCVGKQVYLFYHRISLIDGVNVFENFQLDGMGYVEGKESTTWCSSA